MFSYYHKSSNHIVRALALAGMLPMASTAFTHPIFMGLGDLPGGLFVSIAEDVSADGQVVVGTSISTNGDEAFIWDAVNGIVGLGDLPGGGFSSGGFGVSADGQVVVGGSNSSNGFEAFRWTQGSGMVGLGDLPGGSFDSFARDVSANGQVVVGGSISSNGNEAFIWNVVDGMLSLQDLLTDLGLDLTGWQLLQANGISADGLTIVGSGFNPSGDTEAWLARLEAPSVPEPGTLSLLTLGLAALGFRFTRCHQHS